MNENCLPNSRLDGLRPSNARGAAFGFFGLRPKNLQLSWGKCEAIGF